MYRNEVTTVTHGVLSSSYMFLPPPLCILIVSLNRLSYVSFFLKQQPSLRQNIGFAPAYMQDRKARHAPYFCLVVLPLLFLVSN
jgi:hypothetical protein